MINLAEYQHGNGMFFGTVALLVSWAVVAAAFAIHVHHFIHCGADETVRPTASLSAKDSHRTLTTIGSLVAVLGACITANVSLGELGGWTTLLGWIPWIAAAVGGLYFHLVHQKQ
ncbi:hypothetical protein ACIQOV_13170 [Kitasatospora sp. NPDC091257]|uniref:hypothetical protein n=1 Tax=Kitasatospora sp. NPDC091257 TaxID=3364084 RepID=UPI0038197CFA